jgi:hypothetical protein
MNIIKKLKTKEGITDKVELVSASIFLIVGKFLHVYAGEGIAILASSLWMIGFTIVLIVFFQHQVFGKDKPWLAVFSIYYKSLAYVTIFFALANLPGKEIMFVTTLASAIIYSILSSFIGKQNNQILTAYLYLILVSLAWS